MTDGFGPGVAGWVERLGAVRDVVRQELVARQVRAHLPAAGASPRVLDIGCGQGTQALRLAADGYRVDGVDPSAELLERARRDTAAAPPEVRARVRWWSGELAELAARRPGEWDAVCCHGVVMYLPSLPAAVRALVGLVRPGGLVSLLTRNQAGIALRAGLAGRWDEALAGFDAERYVNRLGLAGVRADRPERVRAALRAAGADPLAWYGVRLFTDPRAADEPPPAAAELAGLLAAEEQAGRRDPYRRLAALTHTLAVRRGAGAPAAGRGPAGEASRPAR